MAKKIIRCSKCGKLKRVTRSHLYHFGNECEHCVRAYFKWEAQQILLEEIYK